MIQQAYPTNWPRDPKAPDRPLHQPSEIFKLPSGNNLLDMSKEDLARYGFSCAVDASELIHEIYFAGGRPSGDALTVETAIAILRRERAEAADLKQRVDELEGLELPGPLTFAHFTEVSLSRSSRWHTGGITDWSLSDWAVALAGEVGEALNVVKKLNRERDGITGNTVSAEQLVLMLKDEIGDIAAYLVLFAARAEIDLDAAIVDKFNVVSERFGFPERL